jgi:hypothetical protein
MQKLALTIFFLIGMLLAPVAAQDWYQLTSQEGAFVASFPAEPKYKAVPIRNGELTLHQWQHEKRDKNVYDLASYIDYRKGHRSNLDTMTKGLLEGGPLISERRITHSGHATRDVLLRDTASGLIIHQRHMMVGDRAYIWNYAGPEGTENGPDVQRFLNSLTLQR